MKEVAAIRDSRDVLNVAAPRRTPVSQVMGADAFASSYQSWRGLGARVHEMQRGRLTRVDRCSLVCCIVCRLAFRNSCCNESIRCKKRIKCLVVMTRKLVRSGFVLTSSRNSEAASCFGGKV
jgi:hypothetical protein